MAGSGANSKLLAMALLLVLVVVALVVVDKQTDHFTKVKAWTSHFMPRN